jgi:hypothetical protein
MNLSTKTISEARKDPAVFFATVMRDGEGKPIAPTAAQKEWLRQSEAHRRTTIWAHIESGITTFVIARILLELGTAPESRILLVVPSLPVGALILNALRYYILEDDQLAQTFPHLKERGLSESHQLQFRLAGIEGRDHSVFAVAPGGGVLGHRIDTVIMDGVVNRESSRTPETRRKLVDWYRSSVLCRLPEGSTQIGIGQSWFTDDLMSVITDAKPGHFSSYPLAPYPMGLAALPRWSLERVERVRKELGPASAAVLLDLKPVVVEESGAPAATADAAAYNEGDHVSFERRQGISQLVLRIDDVPGETVQRTEKMLGALHEYIVSRGLELITAQLSVDKSLGRKLVLTALLGE